MIKRVFVGKLRQLSGRLRRKSTGNGGYYFSRHIETVNLGEVIAGPVASRQILIFPGDYYNV